jgi:O-antigen ligase
VVEPRRRLDALVLESAGLLVAAPLWIWWAVWKGGYPPAIFLAGVAYLALAALALRMFAPQPKLGDGAAWPLIALAALTAWTLFSLLWAEDRGAAETTAARQVLLLGSFALPVLWPPSARALVVGIALVPAVALCGAVSALGGALGDVTTLVDGRLAGPTGYTNASAALFAAGGLTAVVLASRRELEVPLRAAALGASGGLFGTFVLTQSRGGVVALALTLLLAFVLLQGRLRLLVPLALVALVVAAILDPLLEVRRLAVEGGDAATALRDGVRALAFATLGLWAIGTAYAAVDSRIEVKAALVRRLTAAAAVLLTAALLAGAAAVVASGPDPGEWVSQRVEDFKTPDYGSLESQPTRFTGDLGSNRYDYWRVSAEIFADEPLTGSGAGNFIAPFLERRHAPKSTLYSHSIWLGTLAELGAPGFLALVAFFATLTWALVRAARRRPARRWIVVAAVLPLAYVLLHGTIDWISVFPVVVAPPLALAGAALGIDRQAGPGGRGSKLASLAIVAALVLAALPAAPLLVANGLSDRAVATWRARPAGAAADLERAASLDPLSSTPFVRLGVIDIALERPAHAREAFHSALERDSSAWYPELQLGLLAAAAGQRERAIGDLEAALARNPREPAARSALQAVRAGKSPDPAAVQSRVLEAGE